jgi:hypothetical protein
MFPALKELQFLQVQVVDKEDGRGKLGLERVLEWKWSGKGFALKDAMKNAGWEMESQFAMLAYQGAWNHWRSTNVSEGADHDMAMEKETEMEMPIVRLMELVREDEL